MPTENAQSGEKWTPERIKKLRKDEYGESQTEFGLRIFATSPSYAQQRMSKLERGDIALSAAIVKHLERLS